MPSPTTPPSSAEWRRFLERQSRPPRPRFAPPDAAPPARSPPADADARTRERNARQIAYIIGRRARLSRAELAAVLRSLFLPDSEALRVRIAVDDAQTAFDAAALRDLLTDAVNGAARDPLSRALRQVLAAAISNLHWQFPAAHSGAPRPGASPEPRAAAPAPPEEEEEEEREREHSASYDEDEEQPPARPPEPAPAPAPGRRQTVAGTEYLPDFYDYLDCHVNSPLRLVT
jgi:hypothetical protein